jgi:hypothetical protein
MKVSMGKTYNIGNYESVRLDVGLEEDFDPTADYPGGDLFTFMMRNTAEMLARLEEHHKVGDWKEK